MKVVKLHSWDIHANKDGMMVFNIHRHDGSILEVPMAKDLKPVGVPEIQYLVVDGQYAGFTGYVHKGWIPQSA